MQPKKLGIAQLSLSLFLLKQKNTQGTFDNSPSIPAPALREKSHCVGRVPQATARGVFPLLAKTLRERAGSGIPTTERSTATVGVFWRF
ncbi:hypothetical protein [Tolypothrix sp. VBCCA 56010]|uniref:hypothetical protein n=1 Tax=Tolypothrix sp. VBCCA 56010 TaxID=3137731 RepID=UPI003D7C8EC6